MESWDNRTFFLRLTRLHDHSVHVTQSCMAIFVSSPAVCTLHQPLWVVLFCNSRQLPEQSGKLIKSAVLICSVVFIMLKKNLISLRSFILFLLYHCTHTLFHLPVPLFTLFDPVLQTMPTAASLYFFIFLIFFFLLLPFILPIPLPLLLFIGNVLLSLPNSIFFNQF